MSEDSIDTILKENIGKEIDITIVHHVEGRHLRTTGKLLSFDQDIIVIELEWREHWYSLRKKRGRYICNRKASSLLSIFLVDE